MQLWASLVVGKAFACNAGKTWVQFLGRKVPLEKEMTTYSSILAWRIPWAEEPMGYSPQDPKELGITEVTDCPRTPLPSGF